MAAERVIDRMGIAVGASENREFSYTDGEAGFFYGRTHAPDPASTFAGWNVAGRRVLSDYSLFLDGRELPRAAAAVEVFPDRLVRRFPGGAVETLRLFDRQPILGIALSGTGAARQALRVASDWRREVDGAGLWLVSPGAGGAVALVAPWNNSPVTMTEAGDVQTGPEAGGFVIVTGSTRAGVLESLGRFRQQADQGVADRRQRMDAVVATAGGQVSSDPGLDRALAWLTLTGDQLVSRQLGTGIYAGLPWFNDYWGRDTFISLAGLTLVTGQFEVAREVLVSFARLQDTNPASPTFGRVPNRARPDEIIYNTADGTPRFVIALLEYVQYSGDTSILAELFPAVARATDGALANRTDAAGYLTHDDADTWMDAKEKGTRPFSPRGNRANDIQALWHGQLVSAARMADLVGDDASARRWRAAALRVEKAFPADFIDPTTGAMADRLTADGARDMSMRPNQLFALDLVPDAGRRMGLVRTAWEALVYPWGVASLGQDEDDFHPYHEHWHYYHKDAAYHNGTVWLWLNGIAMQRLLELDHPEPAFTLFSAMNDQALRLGAVGSLSENADALPRPGADRAALSGTFLQAWSNAEQLRVWHQHFLGIRPDMLAGEVVVRPRLPEAVRTVDIKVRVGSGGLRFAKAADPDLYRVEADGISPTILFSLPAFAPLRVAVPAGAALEVRRDGDALRTRLVAADGVVQREWTVAKEATAEQELEARRAFLRDLGFARPNLRPDLKSLRHRHDPPLTY